MGRMLDTKTFITFGWQQLLITYSPIHKAASSLVTGRSLQNGKMSMGNRRTERPPDPVLYGGRPSGGFVNRAVMCLVDHLLKVILAFYFDKIDSITLFLAQNWYVMREDDAIINSRKYHVANVGCPQMICECVWLACKKLGAVCFCLNFGKKSNTTTYKSEYVAPYDTYQPFLSIDRKARHVKEISKAWNNQSKCSFHVARKGVNIRVLMFRFSHFV